MPRRGAFSGSDKRAGIAANLRINFEGTGLLTSKNQMDNPSLTLFDVNGDLEGWRLDSPPEEVGFSPYVRGPGFPRLTKQEHNVRFERGFWDARDPLIEGDSLPDETRRAAVAPFAHPPEIELIEANNVGFAEGWRGFAYVYGIGRPNGRHLLTTCSPLVAAFGDQGQIFIVSLPETAPDGISFLGIGCTKPFNTEAQALNATDVWLQDTVSTDPKLPATKKLVGPFNRREKLSFTENETFLAGFDQLPPPETRIRKRPGQAKSRKPRQIAVSYALKTSQGTGPPQGVKEVNLSSGEEVEWWPRIVPDGAEWEPHFQDTAGEWQALSPRKASQRATMSSNDEAEATEDTSSVDRSEDAEDATGFEGPDSALEAPEADGRTIPPTGRYHARLTKNTLDPDDDTEGETRAGPPGHKDVTPGHYMRIRPPKDYQNWIKNPEGTQRKNDEVELPEDWERPDRAGVTNNDDEPGKQKRVDTSNSTTDEDVIRTARVDLGGTKPKVVHRAKLKISARTGGRVHYILKQFLANGSNTETVVGNFSANGEYDIRVRINDEGSPDVLWNANVEEHQFIVRHVGSTAAGARNLTTTLSDPLLIKGHAVPRKRDHGSPVEGSPAKKRRRVSLPIEKPEKPYPVFGYTVVVLDPPESERPVSGAGFLEGNYVEYFGPKDTPISSTYFMDSMKIPVKPNEIRTFSAHFYWEDPEKPATPLKLLVKDAQGRVIQDLGGFVSSVTGDSADQPDADANGYVRRKITVTPPEDAAYVEFISGGAGDGLFRVGWFQNEVGPNMTAYTDDVAPEGSLISTFDLGIPGVPADVFARDIYVESLVRIGAEVTLHESGETSYVVEARSKSYGAAEWPATWETAAADLTIYPEGTLVQVRTTLATDDLDFSPKFHSHFLDFERGFKRGRFLGALCRADGTEFEGGVTLYDFPPIRTQNNFIEEEAADGTRGYGVMGKETKWADGFGFECHLNSTAEELMALQGEDNEDEETASVVVAEIFGKRHRIRMLSAPVVAENREAHDPIEGLENEGRWNLRAEGVVAEVLSQEAL